MNPADRRKYARMPLEGAATLSDFTSGHWTAACVDVSPFGIKVALEDADLAVASGRSIKVRFGLPDGGGDVEVLSTVVRADKRHLALAFVNLEMADYRRVAALVDAFVRGDRAPATSLPPA